MDMNKLVCIFRKGLHFSLSIFLITFSITLYVKGNPNVFGIMYILVSFLSGVLFLLKFQNLKKIIGSFLKVIRIMMFVLNTLLYISAYDKLHSCLYTGMLCFIGILFLILNIWRYRKNIIMLLFIIILALVLFVLFGVLAYTDFSVSAFIFLFGLLFAVIENLEKFIKLDNCYPKEIVTLENDEKIKKNKVVLNFIIGILFFLIYIFLKILELEALKKCIFQRTILGELNEVLAVGILRVVTIEILVIFFMVILGSILRSYFKEDSRYIENSDSENVFEVIFNIISLGIKSKSLPKAEERVAIGKEIIDNINPEILIENRREIPKDTHVLLSKVEDRPTIRNLLIIYPNKEVYRCKFNVGEDITTRITEVELVDP